jgi:hypothetical protein
MKTLKFYKLFMFITIIGLLSLTSCEQFVARHFGTNVNINVEKGYKVTSATWKGTDLFYFIEPMEKGYQPKVKKFIESSNYGVLESEVVFKEFK